MANLLLVEDDATLIMSLEMTLQAHGHAVTVCRRLSEARAALNDGLPLIATGDGALWATEVDWGDETPLPIAVGDHFSSTESPT